MTPEELGDALAEAVAHAVREGDLPPGGRSGPPGGATFRPTDERAPGVVSDWVTPVAQRWAPMLGMEPHEVARALARGLGRHRGIESVEVAPSGLVLLTLTPQGRGAVVDAVLGEPDAWALPADRREPPSDEAPGARPAGDPVRRAQTAHARLCRLVRNAEAVGVEVRGARGRDELLQVAERRLLVGLADLPRRLAAPSADSRAAVSRLAGLSELTRLTDDWRAPVRPAVVGAPIEPVHGARLGLARAARLVLRNGLWRLGAPAPERM